MRVHKSAAIFALAALTISQAAEAKRAEQCITEHEVVGLLRFALPSVIEGTMRNCSAHLPSDGFMAVSGEAMRQKYLAGQDEAWPMARQAFLKFGGTDEIGSVPDEALKPVLVSVIGEKMTEEVKPSDCGDIEHIMEIADRIAPDDFTALAGAIFSLAVGEKNKTMPICKTR